MNSRPVRQSLSDNQWEYAVPPKLVGQPMDRPGPTRLVGPGPTKLVGQPMGVCRSDEACRTTNGSARSDKTGRTRSHKLCRNLEDFPCKKEKVEDFVFKLEEVVEIKVAYFYTPSPKN